MKRLALLSLLLLSSCATDVLPDGARFQSNTQERLYSNGVITYHTLNEDHATPTAAMFKGLDDLVNSVVTAAVAAYALHGLPMGSTPSTASRLLVPTAPVLSSVTHGRKVSATPIPVPMAKLLH